MQPLGSKRADLRIFLCREFADAVQSARRLTGQSVLEMGVIGTFRRWLLGNNRKCRDYAARDRQ
jgi:hypothetical protein